MKLAEADQKKLLPLLETLAGAVEEMLLSGLTAASEATRQALHVSFQEASRMRLLRLGSTLRAANEELGRYTRGEGEFSKRRLSFFLGRTWLLSRGLAGCIRNSDAAAWERLLYVPPSRPVEKVEVVTLGIAKKHVKDSFCGFDFRLRTVSDNGELPAGQSLVWSCIFPLKPGLEVPPEGFLHLPQKQKFKPHIFLGKKTLAIEQANVSIDARGSGRLTMGEATTISEGEAFSGWDAMSSWQPQAALENLKSYEPGPFDLEIDLQEEVVLSDWEFVEGDARQRDGQMAMPIERKGVPFDLLVSAGSEGAAAREALTKLRCTKTRPPLFGLMHYQMGRLVVQPLALLKEDGPSYVNISDKNVDRKALLAALKF